MMNNMETTNIPNQRVNIWLVVGLAGIFYILGQYIASQPDRIKEETAANREITVTGRGEAIQRPDVARVVLAASSGVQSDADQAMQTMTKQINQAVDAIKAENIKEDDIKTTGLTVYPTYDYADGRQTLRGFEAREEITVTIRDMSKVGTIIGLATTQGINQIGGVSFEIDDQNAVQLTAKKSAINDARQQAEELADELGVRLGKVKNFNANMNMPAPQPLMYREKDALGSSGQPATPEVLTGTQTITADVTVTYELL